MLVLMRPAHEFLSHISTNLVADSEADVGRDFPCGAERIIGLQPTFHQAPFLNFIINNNNNI